ncbi:hypothetical protein [Zoogloea sp. LCSB751]|uniref:hypothetical protein n=1 Tax=Zoogloea sp. LCSB751 TaxID=1965277 RepID=UPI0013747760|nr:hypothetical protein [Zoogloea sp. LCSB751]
MTDDTDASSTHAIFPGQERDDARLALIRWIAAQLVDQCLAEAATLSQETPDDENCDLR